MTAASAAHPEALPESTVEQLQQSMARGSATAEALAQESLERIRLLDRGDKGTRAVFTTNPDALRIARELDGERRAGRVRGPLHGVPVLVKDNIDTGDRMPTTAGSPALANAPAARDAFVIRKLREAGAVIVGKANLSEWANFRGNRSTSGWSTLGGVVRNPYGEGRNACGSSSGSAAAMAMSLAAVSLGTETSGSIVCPSAFNAVVGLKPTVGLVSRSGVVPISASQDTVGPMTRSVADAAAVLTAIAGVDPDDAATAAATGHVAPDYRAFLQVDGLQGARIGVARKRLTGYSAKTDRVFEQAIADLRRLGAEIVDPADIGNVGEYGDDLLNVLLFEFKAGLNAYLAQRPGLEVKTLADVIAFNEAQRDRVLKHFGQELFLQAQAKGGLDDPAYLTSRERLRRLAREGIDRAMDANRLDAIVAPTTGPAWLTDLVNGDSYSGSAATAPAAAGYPHLTVPMGQVEGLPVGLSFIGRAWSEGTLLKLGYAYEQGTKHRKAPPAVR